MTISAMFSRTHFIALAVTLAIATPALSQEIVTNVGPSIGTGENVTVDRNAHGASNFRRSMATTSLIDQLSDPGATDESDPSYLGDNLGNHSAAGNVSMNTHNLMGAGEVHSNLVFAFNYFYHSDERLKRDVATLTPEASTEIIRSVRPVRYVLKETGAQSMGVIAQEIELVLPDIVNTNDEGIKSVDYVQLIAPMIATIQNLEQRIAELEAQQAPE